LIRKSLTNDLIQQIDPVKNDAWTVVQSKWYGYSSDEDFIGSAEHRFDHAATPSPTTNAPSWCSVLEVTPEASPDEIRKAFYAARKKYNPDIAATMGEDIQQLANERSKAINLAYEEARAAKGF
jgi:DnaJ-domain-containing protein 1